MSYCTVAHPADRSRLPESLAVLLVRTTAGGSDTLDGRTTCPKRGRKPAITNHVVPVGKMADLTF